MNDWQTENLLPDPEPTSWDYANIPTLAEVLAETEPDEEPSWSWLMAHYG